LETAASVAGPLAWKRATAALGKGGRSITAPLHRREPRPIRLVFILAGVVIRLGRDRACRNNRRRLDLAWPRQRFVDDGDSTIE